MGRKKFTSEQVGQFKAVLDLGWSLSRVQDHFKKSIPLVIVSQAYLSRIRSGKLSRPKSNNKTGRKPKLNSGQVRRLLKQVDNVDPPTLKEMASKYNVSPSTVHRIIKKNSRRLVKKPKVHAMSPDTIDKRAKRSWPLYMRLKKDRWRRVITSDEAWIYLSRQQGKRTIQYLKQEQRRSEAEVQTSEHHPKGLMVWVAFSADHVFKPIFVKAGAKIDSKYYCKKIIKPFFKKYQQVYPEINMLFHQDSATSHVSKYTLPFLDSKGIKYITKEEWMPNSPDAAPCDYFLWGYLKHKILKRKVRTIEGLKRAVRQELLAIPRDMIERALKSWPKRCREIYKNKVGHIENFK